MRLAFHERLRLVSEGIENARHYRRLGIVLVGAALLTVGAVSWVGVGRNTWHSSPTQSRAHLELWSQTDYDPCQWFTKGTMDWERMGDTTLEASWNGLQKDTFRSRYQQNQWSHLAIKSAGETSALVEGIERPEADRTAGSSIPVQSQHANAANAAKLEGGELQLRAIAATWRNFVDENDEPLQEPVFYDAVTSQPLSPEERSRIPASFLTMGNGYPGYLFVCLLFEVEGDLPFEAMEVRVFDARTKAMLGARRHWDRFEPRLCFREGTFVAINLDCGVWHDTPLEIMVDLPAGAPQRQKLAPNGPQTFQFLGQNERRIRIDRLLIRPGSIEQSQGIKGPLAEFAWIPDRSPLHGWQAEEAIWDLGNLLQADFLELRAKKADGELFRTMLLNHARLPEATDYELVYYPERQRCWFQVAGLPMVPNSRTGTHDLLDVRIPSPIKRVGYDWVASMAQLSLRDYHTGSSLWYRLDPPMKDATLREMLRISSKGQNERVTIDQHKLELKVRPEPEEPKWLQAVRDGWKKIAP